MQSSTSISTTTSNAASSVRPTALALASVNPNLGGDDSLSYAEIGLLLAALSTLACSMMLSVIIP